MQQKSMRDHYDLIVVGAGTAGSIIAAHAAERGVRARDGEPLQILMLEAGPDLHGKLQPGYGAPSRRGAFTNLPHEESGRWVWPWPEACKMVGGSTMHWGNNAYTPYDIDYVHWMDESGVDWSKEKFQESVGEIVREFNIGEIPDEVYTPGNRLFREAVTSMGYQTSYVPSGRQNCLYCGLCGAGNFCRYDAKANVLGYVWRARQKGVELVAGAEVEKVVIERQGEKGVARGVVFREKDGTVRQANGGKILVSCGTYGTPILLARSGYGPREQLGDKTLVHNTNLGKNLEIQPGHDVWAYYDADVIGERGAGNAGHYFWPESPADGNNVVTIRSTIMSFPVYPHAAALRSFAPRFGRDHKEYMRSAIRRIGGVRASILTPLVKGSINVVTGETNYPYSDSRNVKRLHWAAEVMREIHKKMGASKIEEQVPNSFTGGHPTGTCRAGSDPQESVVNPRFESHDIENLLICDGGVIPRSCLGHKCIPVCSIAAFAARRIIADHFTRA
ncbi:MAG: GMC family oxidoreductase [Acidobacteria bacterium]|nr:GMC family oxidoreductase [Acidobacteriota bacterium]